MNAFPGGCVDIGGRVTYLSNASMKVTISVTNYDNSGLHTIDAVLHLMLDNPPYRGLGPAEHGGTCTNMATCPVRLNNAIQIIAQLIVCSATALLSRLLWFYFHRTFTFHNILHNYSFFYPSHGVLIIFLNPISFPLTATRTTFFSATIVDIGGRVTYLGNPSMRVTISVTNYDNAGPHTTDLGRNFPSQDRCRSCGAIFIVTLINVAQPRQLWRDQVRRAVCYCAMCLPCNTEYPNALRLAISDEIHERR
jgi:acyl-CoA hydrolase